MTSPKTSKSARSRTPALPTPEEYSEFVGQIDLLDVWLIEARVENRHGPGSPRQAGVAISSPEPSWNNVADGFEVRFPYDVSFADGNTAHALLSVTFGLQFSSRNPMTEGIFAIFKDVNLPVNTWPFLREFVSTTLGRMGWQPFTLPAHKMGVPDDDADTETAPKKRQKTRTRRGGAGGE